MTSAVPTGRICRRARRRFAPALKSATRNPQSAIALLLLTTLLAVSGCGRGPQIIAEELRKPIDRSLVEVPAGLQLERFITNLRAPSAIAFDTEKNVLLVAESGADNAEPRILAFDFADPLGKPTIVYPQGKVLGPFRSNPFRMYGPIGGMAVRDGKIYVSHRDHDDLGVISAITYDGKGSTVIAGLPAQGDYGVTDLAFSGDGKLYFGVGAATNSGVVGLDNWDAGWVQKHPKVSDVPHVRYRLRGFRFDTPNPKAGLFTGSELAVTAPFQPFGQSYRGTIEPSPGGKPSAAIYSIDPSGGVDAPDLRVYAHGIRMPAGLAFDENQRLYATNQGMELRGTRPVREDPNTVLRINSARWYGWPDFSADLRPITDDAFKPPSDMIRRTGYSELNFLLDHIGELSEPDQTDRDLLVCARFPALTGAAKMTFVGDAGPLSEYSRKLIVTLSGDRAPFANSGRGKLKGPFGYKVVLVDPTLPAAGAVSEFIRNTAGVPRSQSAPRNPDLLERPVDVKFGPDGYLYVLDFGRMEVRSGRDRVMGNTGQVFRLRPLGPPATMPAPASETPASADQPEPSATGGRP
jgi:glucose/arabinose dehydrogenase